MKTPTLRIDLRAEIAAAWDRCWKRNLESRLKGYDYGGRSYYLSATDLERDMREEFSKRMNSCRVRVLGLNRRPLLDHVRSWLSGRVGAGVLEADSRGRGHCSGMRFRPAGAPASPAEKKVDALPKAERDRRRHVRHLTVEPRDRTSYRDPRRACYVAPKKKKRMSFRPNRRTTYPTPDPANVTCKKCLKILERDFVRVVVFGEEKPVLARVLARDPEGTPSVAVDATGELRLAAELEFLPAIPASSRDLAAGNG